MVVADAGFSVTLTEWHDVLLMIATGAASLLGFLGVAISLNLRIIRRDDKAHLRLLSNQTFYSFLRVFSIATLLLVPRANPVILGVAILCISLQGISSFAARRNAQVRESLTTLRRAETAHFLWRFLVPMLCNIIIAIACGPLILGESRVLYVFVGAALATLATATRNAWDLLMQVSDESGSQTPPNGA